MTTSIIAVKIKPVTVSIFFIPLAIVFGVQNDLFGVVANRNKEHVIIIILPKGKLYSFTTCRSYVCTLFPLLLQYCN